MSERYKIPLSVLVVIHTPALDVLLIKRADAPEFWQSVTGSKDNVAEDFRSTAAREVREETGIDCAPGTALHAGLVDWHLENIYDIYPRWQHRYAPAGTPVTLNPREHTASQWLSWREAADRCYSPSNAEAILLLPKLIGVKFAP